MKFIDEINIYVSSGKGGDGCLSFCKEKYLGIGKPDGGNGGAGGNVYFVGCSNVKTFASLVSMGNYKAEDANNGKSSNKTGKNGKNLYLLVPLGTIIYDNDTGSFIGEILTNKFKLLVTIGGSSGIGNAKFKSSKNRIPKRTILGSMSEIRFLRLELNLLSHVGLLGFPNVGKSSFLTSVSRSNSKVGNYEFTTLYPNLGVVSIYYLKKFIIADMPGIIKGASEGIGLGFKFLSHISRVNLILHVVDISSVFLKSKFKEDVPVITEELKKFNKNLFYKKDIWLILNKIDLIDNVKFDTEILNLISTLNYKKVFYISSKTYVGLKRLCFNIDKYLYFNNK